MTETVAILGASTNPARFAYKAQLALLAHGHTPVPVNPKYGQVDGITCYPDLASFGGVIDTVTVYVRPAIVETMTEELLRIRPARVIFNPGSESRTVSARLDSAGIRVQNACTLVLLDSHRFHV